MPTAFLFTELTTAALTPGQAFDGLTVGTFRDMYGQVVTFTQELLAELVANTIGAINVLRTESGEVVGLPIDAKDHDKGDGAGWIMGVELSGELIRILPKWTELGREIVGKGIRRFFSATVDLENKVIRGGTLTNWPAVRGPQGQQLLRPIELAAHPRMYEFAADESLDEKSSKVRQAFYDEHQPDMSTPWVLEVYDDYLICRYGESLYRVPYEVAADGTPKFAAETKWVEVKPAYVEAAAPPPANAEGDDEMGVTLEDVKAVVNAAFAEFKATLPAPVAPPPAAPATTVDLSSFFDLSGLDDAAKAERKTQIEAHLAAVRGQATREYQAQIAQLQREGQVAELAQRVTAGSETAPRGIPGVTAADLQAHLLRLDPAEAAFFGGLLERVVKDGLVQFTELGHGKRLTGVTPLPAEFASKLDSGELAIVDLSNPILGLGDLAAYDLSKWQGK